MNTYVIPLSSRSASLETVGGKGLSPAKMIQAGFPVPDGFHVTTDAYRTFVKVNDLQARILAVLKDVDTSIPAGQETASQKIHDFFEHSPIPADLANAIPDAYRAFDDEHAVVAVCSSAIAYRIKNKIDQNCVALAVVVQEMVNAEAAGILFAANPINGRRDELVVNAAWGLGESIVGVLVSPDSIVADKTTGKVKKYQASEKTVIIMVTESGTRQEPLDDARHKSRVLKETFARRPKQSEWVK